MAIALLAFTAPVLSAPPLARAQLASGTDCGCANTGAFVDADPGIEPIIPQPNGDSAAANPKYRVVVTQDGGNLPSTIEVLRLSDTTALVQTSGTNWGFSPDQDRFLIWTVVPVPNALLYDLAAPSPNTPVHTFGGNYSSYHFTFSNDGRFFLMSGLITGTVASTAHLEYVHAATGALRLQTDLPINAGGSAAIPEFETQAAGWGFGPDPSRVVNSWIENTTTARFAVYDLVTQAPPSPDPLILGQTGISGFWQFSPCGDVFGLVNQTSPTGCDVNLWQTRDGAPIGNTAFNDLTISLSTTATHHQATAPNLGTTVDLAANTAQDVCADAPPTADFSTAGILEAGQTISYTDASSDTDGTITSWSWDFGDGTTSSLQNPTHVYAAGGTFSVTLTVTDSGGQTGSATRQLRICSAPVAGSGKLLFGTYSALSSGNLFALNMDGSGLVGIMDNDGMYLGQRSNGVVDADYSPDGSKIAWIDTAQDWYWYPGDEAGLFVSNADGSNRTRVLAFSSPSMVLLRPRWTPDGRSIAFYLRDVIGASEPRHGIYLIDADGSNLRLVHQNSYTPYHITYPGGFSPVPAPSCAPGSDGCWTLAVQCSEGPVGGGGTTQIYRVQGDGTGFTLIAPGTRDQSPRFSPDGARIAFVRGLPEELCVMNADGTEVHSAGTGDGDTSEHNPVWSPDATQIALTRTTFPGGIGQQSNVVVMNADGCHETTVALSSGVLSWAAGSETQGLGNIFGGVYFGGDITNRSPAGVGVTAFWNGGSASALTDPDGSYLISGIPVGVTITLFSASYPGYVYRPVGYTFPNFAGNAYGVYLGMLLDHWTLQGTVRDGDRNPVAGVTIDVSGQPTPVPQVTTGADGTFSFELPPNEFYTVAPVTAGYEYTPPSALVVGGYGSVVTQDFTAVPLPPLVVRPTIPGGTYLTPQWVGFSTNRPATVHYTTDGTPATTASPEYPGPMLIGSTTTIHFIAVDSLGNATADTEVTYTFREGADVWAWGSNGSGQLGDGTANDGPLPVAVTGSTGLPGVRAVAGGANGSVAVTRTGAVWAWGSNASGQLGDGSTTDSLTPVQATAANGQGAVIAVAAGTAHTVALDDNGNVWAWGSNASGQLGDDTTNESHLPVQVSTVSGLGSVIAVAAGGDHTVALDRFGAVWEWGSTVGSASPVPVDGLSGATAVAAGNGHAVALRGDGTVWAWGANAFGQLGDGTTTPSPVPVQVIVTGGAPLTDVVSIAAGGLHTAALKGDGTVWTWGNDDFGQLGNGTTTGSPAAIQVTGIANAIGVAAGDTHTTALMSSGTVWAWGAWAASSPGSYCIWSPSPVQVDGLAGVAAVASGGNHSLALKAAPPVATALSFPADPAFATDGLAPDAGTVQTEFTYKIVCTSTAIPAPSLVNVCIDDVCSPMSLDTAADPQLSDGDFANGEQYAFTAYSPYFLAGAHTYRFEASDGTAVVTLPASGDLTGPTVSDLAITSGSLPFGVQGAQYTGPPLSATGGTGPYTWSAPDLPAGFTIDPATGALSGVPALAGQYAFTVSVTDTDGFVYELNFALFVNLSTAPPQVQTFEVTDLGTLGGTQSLARALNNAGQVTGYSTTAGGETHAFLYSNGVMTDLGTLPGGNYSIPTALNGSGQVIGSATTAGTYYQVAFLYSNGVMTALTLPGGTYSEARAINDAGAVVGRSGTSSPSGNHAFLYSGGTMTDLGLLLGVNYSVAAAINSAGQVAGCYQTAGYANRAFLYSGGVVTDLGTLPGGTDSCATAINDSGQVAGYARTAGGDYHAFLYSNGQMTDLGAFEGATTYEAAAINNQGQVVGRAITSTANFYSNRAFLYDGVSGLRDLGTLGGLWTSYGAVPAINGSGQVVGNSTTADGVTHAFIYENGVMKLISTLSPGWQALTSAVDVNGAGQIAGYGTINGEQHAFLARPTPASGQVDVGVTVAASPDPVAVGQPVTITATVTNHGTEPATNVDLLLPMTVVFGGAFTGITVTFSQGTCDPVVAGNPAHCSLGTLAASASATVVIVGTPSAAAAPLPGTNTVGMPADVTAAEPDPVAANNHFEDWFGVNQSGVPAVSVSTPTRVVAAGARGGARFLFTRTGSLSRALRVVYSVGGTAAPGGDYQTLSGNFTVPAGVASGTLSFAVFADSEPDEDETVILTLEPDQGYLVSTPESATVTIRTNLLPRVTISAPDAEAAESPGDPGTIRVTRTAPTRLALPVYLAVGGTARRGADYDVPLSRSRSVSIPAGESYVDVAVTPLDDPLVEAPETVVLTLAASPTGSYALGPSAERSAAVTISSDEVPAVSVSASAAEVVAGDFRSGLDFRRGGDLSGALTVAYAVGGTAEPGSDYERLGESVTIPPGRAGMRVSLRTHSDRPGHGEEDETVEVTVSPGVGYLVGAPSSATVTIRTNLPPVVTISAPDAEAAESPGDPGTIRVTRTAPTRLALPVYLAVGGTARRGADYEVPLSRSRSVSIPAGESYVDVAVTPLDDPLVEAPETVVLTLAASPTGSYALGPSAERSAAVTISSDEVPAVSVSAFGSPANEAAPRTAKGFRVGRHGSLNAPLTVSFSLGGTATAGRDYADIPLALTIPAGQAVASIHLSVIDDTASEPDETVSLELTPAGTYSIAGSGTAEVVIVSNE